ncbi:MAG: ABC transporter substrate-binding protein [Terriglobales bacterium]|jgi:putative ABC transport system substrate-binding protein
MRLLERTRLWAALKRLALGLGLIALFSAILLISDLGGRKTASAASSAARAHTRSNSKVVKAAIVYFARDVGTDLCVQGLIDGLKAGGFEEGKNLEVQRADAQGEMMNIPAILQNYDSTEVDLIMTITTPCLAAACSKVKHKPVVFTCVTDPVAAGAGTSPAEHLPFVTGVGSFPPVGHIVDAMQKLVPKLAAVGTMYNPAEANSVKELSVAREEFRNRGIRLEEVAISGSSEVLQAVQILAERDIQLVWVPGDNTAIEGYEGAVKGARDARLPLVSDDCDSLPRGGLACVGLSAHPAGLAAGKLGGRILLGANPKDLPFEEVAVEEMAISRGEAAQLGGAIPPEFSKNVRP